ncbi:hypothetical protein D3C72_1389500 [compost metagenome]
MRQHVARRPIARERAARELGLELLLLKRPANHGGGGGAFAGFRELGAAVLDQLARNLARGLVIRHGVRVREQAVQRAVTRFKPPLLAGDQHRADAVVRRLLQDRLVSAVESGISRHRRLVGADQLFDGGASLGAIDRHGRRGQREHAGQEQALYCETRETCGICGICGTCGTYGACQCHCVLLSCKGCRFGFAASDASAARHSA